VDNATPGSLYCTNNDWNIGTTEITVKVPMTLGVTYRYNNTISMYPSFFNIVNLLWK
jgi:hypothetical protein